MAFEDFNLGQGMYAAVAFAMIVAILIILIVQFGLVTSLMSEGFNPEGSNVSYGAAISTSAKPGQTVRSDGIYGFVQGARTEADTFLGHPEAPVFYNIGDVQETRAMQKVDTSYAPGVSEGFQIGASRGFNEESLASVAGTGR